MTWILIVSILWGAPAVASVNGFTSEKACATAGLQFKDAHNNIRVVVLCVPTGEVKRTP